jgi:hypothetical protein
LQSILLRQPKIEHKDVRKKLVTDFTGFLTIGGFRHDFYVFL